MRQAEALAQALAGARVARVVSSPLLRCRQTAVAVARRAGASVEIDSRLLEIAHGTWEGRLREEIEREDAARMLAWRKAPDSVEFEGGESLAAVDARWREFAATVDGRDAVVVTHDVVVRLAILSATFRPLADLWKPRVRNGGYAEFEVSAGTWHLLQECADAHLGSDVSEEARQAL